MLDNVPLEIQVEIIRRLPVKSLLRFRSVSKSWKSLIDSSQFIASYSGQQQHLLVSYYDRYGVNYVSTADDGIYPQHKVSLAVPLLINQGCIIGCSHGLLCVYGRELCTIWNLSIRKAVGVIVPNVAMDGKYITALGFGVCRETNDPKILKIKHINTYEYKNLERLTHIPIHRQVEVFTLSTGAWRSPYTTNLPRKSIQFCDPQVVIDGFLYWLATDKITTDGGSRFDTLIISFDMTSEEFGELKLPDCLAHQIYIHLSMFKLRESLVVVERKVEANDTGFDVWMMKDGVSKSFTKLFSVNVNPVNASVLGFTKSGAPIVENDGQLVVYEPYSEHRDNVWIYGRKFTFSVNSYVETLLLNDQQDLQVYDI